mgnify:CR=1 FL=1
MRNASRAIRAEDTCAPRWHADNLSHASRGMQLEASPPDVPTLAVLGERHPRGGDVVAALRVAHEVIGAIGGPFDRLAQLLRADVRFLLFPDDSNAPVECCSGKPKHKHRIQYNQTDYIFQRFRDHRPGCTNRVAVVIILPDTHQHILRNVCNSLHHRAEAIQKHWVPKDSW